MTSLLMKRMIIAGSFFVFLVVSDVEIAGLLPVVAGNTSLTATTCDAAGIETLLPPSSINM